jgi:hypothetical protein
MDRPLSETLPQRPQLRGEARRRDASRAAKGEQPPTNANVRGAGLVIAIAFVLMAVLNSSGLKSWARDLPEGWLADELVLRADQWHARMVAWGPGRLRPAIRGMLDSLRELRWDSAAPSAEGPEAESN